MTLEQHRELHAQIAEKQASGVHVLDYIKKPVHITVGIVSWKMTIVNEDKCWYGVYYVS